MVLSGIFLRRVIGVFMHLYTVSGVFMHFCRAGRGAEPQAHQGLSAADARGPRRPPPLHLDTMEGQETSVSVVRKSVY